MPLIILLSIVTKNIIHPKNSPDLGEFRGEYFIGHHGYDYCYRLKIEKN